MGGFIGDQTMLFFASFYTTFLEVVGAVSSALYASWFTALLSFLVAVTLARLVWSWVSKVW